MTSARPLVPYGQSDGAVFSPTSVFLGVLARSSPLYNLFPLHSNWRPSMECLSCLFLKTLVPQLPSCRTSALSHGRVQASGLAPSSV